jgi:hypothetical protein
MPVTPGLVNIVGRGKPKHGRRKPQGLCQFPDPFIDQGPLQNARPAGPGRCGVKTSQVVKNGRIQVLLIPGEQIENRAEKVEGPLPVLPDTVQGTAQGIGQGRLTGNIPFRQEAGRGNAEAAR